MHVIPDQLLYSNCRKMLSKERKIEQNGSSNESIKDEIPENLD